MLLGRHEWNRARGEGRRFYRTLSPPGHTAGMSDPHLFHFSEDPAIEQFEPHPVRVPAERRPGRDWLNGPLVWAIDEWHSPMYFFPRDCPRILLWRLPGTTDADIDRWWRGDRSRRMLAHIEEAWLDRLRATPVYRYRLRPRGVRGYRRRRHVGRADHGDAAQHRAGWRSLGGAGSGRCGAAGDAAPVVAQRRLGEQPARQWRPAAQRSTLGRARLAAFAASRQSARPAAAPPQRRSRRSPSCWPPRPRRRSAAGRGRTARRRGGSAGPGMWSGRRWGGPGSRHRGWW